MQKIGLTGNIGSGKTWVCKVFEALGVPIYYADLEARKILNSPNTIIDIINTFGEKVALNTKEVDRKALAAIVFSDSEELSKLNKLIHPQLRLDFLSWADKHQQFPYVIQEAAILFENGFDVLMNKSITISAPKELRIKRVMERDKTEEEDVLARMNHQWSDEQKENAANYVIINDGIQMVLPQVLSIHESLLEISRE